MCGKKIAGRNIVIFLEVLCILLLTSTIGAVLYLNNYASTHTINNSEYGSLNSQIADANVTISSLNSQLSTLQTEIASNNTQLTELNKQISNLQVQTANAKSNLETMENYYNSLLYVINTENHDLAVKLTTANTQITNLQNQVNALNEIVNLSVSTVWVNNQTVSQQAGSYTTWSEPASYAGYVSIQVSSSTTNTTFAKVIFSSHGVNYNTQTNVGTSGIAYFPILPSSNITFAIGNDLTNGNATENVTVTYYY
jgi:uncharacterized coiled-coil protein SlyX